MMVKEKQFESLVNFKCLRALADPGEAVGLLAAQVRGSGLTKLMIIAFSSFFVPLPYTVYRRAIDSNDIEYFSFRWYGRDERDTWDTSSKVEEIS